MEFEFNSLNEFINYLDNIEINRNVFSNLASESKDYEFCKTLSLEEAKNLCKYGEHRDFQKLVDLKLELENYIKINNMTRRQHNYYVGYAPDVKAYLEGNPLSMFIRDYPTRKHIDIYYNASILGKVTTEQITPNISKEWEVGYGKTANYDMIRDIIDLKNNDIIICQPEEMDINGYDIIEDAKNMFLYLNTINKDFKLKKINH